MKNSQNTSQHETQYIVNKNLRFLSGISNSCRDDKKENTLSNKYAVNSKITSYKFLSLTPPCRHAGYSRRGFTLLEMLVVILIIGILAAVALPQYQKATQKTKAQLFATELLSIRNAIRLYQLENGKSPNLLSDLNYLTTSPVNSYTTRYLGRNYQAISNYFRVYPPLKGTGSCDFRKNGTWAFCYIHNKNTWDILSELGWSCTSPSNCDANNCAQCYLWY